MPPLMQVTIFHPKPGMLDAFIETQTEGLKRLLGETPFPGWRGNRFGHDGQTAVMVSMFDSREAHQRFTERPEFTAHRERLAPLIERTELRFCELVFEAGEV